MLHPALPGSPATRSGTDFTGSTGCFSFVLHDRYGADAAARFIEALEFFGIGASSGIGSLALTYDLAKSRTHWPAQGRADSP